MSFVWHLSTLAALQGTTDTVLFCAKLNTSWCERHWSFFFRDWESDSLFLESYYSERCQLPQLSSVPPGESSLICLETTSSSILTTSRFDFSFCWIIKKPNSGLVSQAMLEGRIWCCRKEASHPRVCPPTQPVPTGGIVMPCKPRLSSHESLNLCRCWTSARRWWILHPALHLPSLSRRAQTFLSFSPPQSLSNLTGLHSRHTECLVLLLRLKKGKIKRKSKPNRASLEHRFQPVQVCLEASCKICHLLSAKCDIFAGC